jgi:NADH-quinone oxidoreductase subunit B
MNSTLEVAPPRTAEAGYALTTLEALVAAAHAGGMWYLTFGLACCAVEMMHTAAAGYDFDRFGMIRAPVRAKPT